MDSLLPKQLSDHEVAVLKEQYDLGQITRRELLNRLFAAGVAASVISAVLGSESAQAAAPEAVPHLVKSTKTIGETTREDWLEALKKEGITSIEQLVDDALKQAKANPGHPKPGADWWIVYNDGRWGLCGPDQK